MLVALLRPEKYKAPPMRRSVTSKDLNKDAARSTSSTPAKKAVKKETAPDATGAERASNGGEGGLEGDDEAVLRARQEAEEARQELRRAAQREIAGALWSLSLDNPPIQSAVTEAGGLESLICMLEDHPDIHRNAAGALWALAQY